ncbi:MAG: isoprenylcysteine carboxylmethyltransferase family protein [Nitrospirota bacterium]
MSETDVNDFLALIILLFWPVIPLFWIPVHFAARFFKRLGLWTYLLPLLTWIPGAYLIYAYRSHLLQLRIPLPDVLNLVGVPILFAGLLLHLWTARLLGLWGIIGVPEVFPKMKKKLVSKGPYSVVRHPTYLAHTMIFSGVFFITEVVALGALTIGDFIIVNAVIIPLEEKELLRRFGKEYRSYQEEVPQRFFPRLPKK